MPCRAVFPFSFLQFFPLIGHLVYRKPSIRFLSFVWLLTASNVRWWWCIRFGRKPIKALFILEPEQTNTHITQLLLVWPPLVWLSCSVQLSLSYTVLPNRRKVSLSQSDEGAAVICGRSQRLQLDLSSPSESLCCFHSSEPQATHSCCFIADDRDFIHSQPLLPLL